MPGCLQAIAAGLSLAMLTAVTAGCGTAADIRRGDIRSYTVPRGQSTVSAAPAGRSSDGDGSRPRLSYELPEGWHDRGGGGMRLATLTIGEPAAGHDVTVIPASGTLEGNVVRWQGQLEPGQDPAAAAEAVAAAMADAEQVEAAGLAATVVLLVDEVSRTAADQPADALSDAGGEAILAAMLPLPGEPEGGAALFVKFKGPAAIARREKDRFVQFVTSLRLEPGDISSDKRLTGRPDEE